MGDKSPKESQQPRSGSSGPTKYDFGDNLYRHSVNNPIIILLRLSEVFPIKPLDTFHFYRIVVVVLVQHSSPSPHPLIPHFTKRRLKEAVWVIRIIFWLFFFSIHNNAIIRFGLGLGLKALGEVGSHIV